MLFQKYGTNSHYQLLPSELIRSQHGARNKPLVLVPLTYWEMLIPRKQQPQLATQTYSLSSVVVVGFRLENKKSK